MGRSRATHVGPPQSPPITPPRRCVNLASKVATNDKSLTDITKNTPKRVVPSNKILSGRGFYSDTRSIIMLRILRCRPNGIGPALGKTAPADPGARATLKPSARGHGATLVTVPEIFQVETPHGPGGLASVLNVMTEAGLVLEHASTVRRGNFFISSRSRTINARPNFSTLFWRHPCCPARESKFD